MIRWLKATFGFGSDAALGGIGRPEAMALIRRARAGDQNAMALLAGTFQAAKAGNNPRAETSQRTILALIAANPPPHGGADFGGRPRTPSRFGPDQDDLVTYRPPHRTPLRFGNGAFPQRSTPSRFGVDGQALSDPGPLPPASASLTRPTPQPATAILSTPPLQPRAETAAHLGVLKWAARGGQDDATDLWCLRLVGQALLCCAAGGDPCAVPIAIVILAQGAQLSATRIVSLIEQAPPAMQAQLDHAVTNSSSIPDPVVVGFGGPGSDPVTQAGRALGQARRLQTLKLGAPIGLYCPVMGSEMALTGAHDAYGNSLDVHSPGRSELRNAS